MSLFAALADILFVGHSLVGPGLPPLLEAALAARLNAAPVVEAQIINGAPLRYQWDHAAEAQGVNGRDRLASGGVSTLILTEGIPLGAQVEWNDSAGYAARWAGAAWQADPAAQVFVYETWHSLDPGKAGDDGPGADLPWTDRIAADLPVWEGIAAAAGAGRPEGAPPVRLIPAGQAMALAAKAAETGALPGITEIGGLFEDDIHPNDRGRYLIAMTHVATLTGASPEGLPARLVRRWESREAVISNDLAAALQRIAWQAAEAQRAREAAGETAPALPLREAPGAAVAPEASDAPASPDAAAIAAEPSTDTAAAPERAPLVPAFTPVTNPALSLGLAAVADWSTEQPFLDVMKTSRPWIAHTAEAWDGMDERQLAEGGWLDAEGWPLAFPPGVTGISTLILTDLPEDAGGVAGRYELRWQGEGELRLDGRARNVAPLPGGGLAFDYTPGEGMVLLTLARTERADPIRRITVVRADRAALLASGAIFNPDWLTRIRGVKGVRFMDWMATNNSTLATVEASPKPDDYSWARNGVPIEVMVALANELDADPWFTLPHLASDGLVRFYAETVADLLKPELKAHVEFSNEVWNFMFGQARWAADQAKARWGDENAWMQVYGLRAAEVMAIWTEVFGDEAPARLVRVIGTQTGWLGLEEQMLDAPRGVAEGRRPPRESFDAYAVTGYFAAMLGDPVKLPLLQDWLTESAAADPAHPHALAIRRAAEELEDGRHSGIPDDTLTDLLSRILPYQAEVARKTGLKLVMYEGGTHVTGTGPVVDEAGVTAFFVALNYAPEMGALYEQLLTGWAGLSDAPFNAYVDVTAASKWGSWGALRHLGDENPRWRALAQGCPSCARPAP